MDKSYVLALTVAIGTIACGDVAGPDHQGSAVPLEPAGPPMPAATPPCGEVGCAYAAAVRLAYERLGADQRAQLAAAFELTAPQLDEAVRLQPVSRVNLAAASGRAALQAAAIAAGTIGATYAAQNAATTKQSAYAQASSEMAGAPRRVSSGSQGDITTFWDLR